MRLRFWNFVHDQLERAWHWVWHHKLEPEYLKHRQRIGNHCYRYYFVNSKGEETPIAPIR
jgi:hypothetical protein